jgi:hypothetical protein
MNKCLQLLQESLLSWEVYFWVEYTIWVFLHNGYSILNFFMNNRP